MRNIKRSVWVVEFWHERGWTTYKPFTDRNAAWKFQREERESYKGEWKFRTVRYWSAERTGEQRHG